MACYIGFVSDMAEKGLLQQFDLDLRSLFRHIRDKATVTSHIECAVLYPLPDMPILGSSNSAANKDMMSNVWTNGDT